MYLGDGTGGLAKAPRSLVVATDIIVDMVSRDFDGDGVLDLALLDENGGAVVCIGAGDGTFTFTDFFPFPNTVGNVKELVADLNGDGRPDLAVVDLTGSSGYELSTLLGSLAHTSTALTATAPSAASPNAFRLVAAVNPAPFQITAAASSGLPVAFKVTGPASISASLLSITGSGFVTVEASQQGNSNYLGASPVTQSFRVFPDGIRIDRIVNAASYYSSAVGSYASIFGYRLAAQTVQVTEPATQLGGVSVTFTDAGGQQFPADLNYVSPNQINLVVPSTLPAGHTTVAVRDSLGNSASLDFTLPVVTPGIFTADGSGTGPPAAYATIVGPDGSTTVAPAFVCSSNPIRCTPAPIGLGPRGTKVYLSIYGTGIRGLSGLAGVTAILGGVPATVIYAGPQGMYPALDQINLLVDPFTGPRLVDLQVTVDSHASNTVQILFR